MNAENRRVAPRSAVMLAFGLIAIGQSAFAEGKCTQPRGSWLDGNPNTNYTGESGVIIQGGILNGTTVVVYDQAFVTTPHPNFVSYISELTITNQAWTSADEQRVSF